MELQIPSHKHQITNNHQAINFKYQILGSGVAIKEGGLSGTT
jgi:hypothetical protein